MREFLRKYNKIIIICILIGAGFLPFVLIRENINRDYISGLIPYEYGQENSQIARFPDDMDYTNRKIHWRFNSSNLGQCTLVVMNDELTHVYNKKYI